jgi:hypothetical protein
MPGVTPALSAPANDFYIGAGVKAIFGLEVQLNVSELFRTMSDSGGC